MRWVDAPVSGGTPGRKAAAWRSWPADAQADIERLRPVLSPVLASA
ncbi:hypothetical protein ACPA9J_31655 [Pseudomonas aeruginosa]